MQVSNPYPTKRTASSINTYFVILSDVILCSSISFGDCIGSRASEIGRKIKTGNGLCEHIPGLQHQFYSNLTITSTRFIYDMTIVFVEIQMIGVV